MDFEAGRSLIMLVPMNTPADAILSPVEPMFFRLSQVAVVRGHVFPLPRLQAGFTVFQAAGFLRAQGAVPDPVGDAMLLPGFAMVYLIYAGMARIDNAWSSARGGSGLGKGGTGKHQPSDSENQE
jgi:hypothetical protein